MKANTHNFYHLFNTVRKSNGIKPFLWYTATNITYYITKLLRILNY